MTDTPVPPWLMHPEIEPGSIGWRMGYGEDYITKFDSFYRSRNAADKAVYCSSHPEPSPWAGFYQRRAT